MEKFVERHGMQLLQTARRYSASPSDAEDAYQRTLEVLLTKFPEGYEADRLLAWALTVTRNEALMEQRRNAKIVDGAFDDIAGELSDVAALTEDRVLEVEELGQGREALERIRPDQMRCLLLRADGLNYEEIGEVTGFSYTKVNRCLSDGRKAFRDHVARLDSGAECRRLAGVLSMLADGVASGDSKVDAELHLKNCLVCQATLRDYRSAPDRAAAIIPVGGLLLTGSAATREGGLLQRVGDAIESAYANLQERLFGHAATIHQGGEMATAKKIGVVAAISASLVAGGVATEKAIFQRGDQQAPVTRQAQHQVIRALAPPAIKPTHSAKKAKHAASRSSRHKAHNATESDAVGKNSGSQVTSQSAPAADPQGVSVPSDPNAAPALPQNVSSHGGSSDNSTGLAP